MSTHTINEAEVNEWLSEIWYRLASSSSARSNSHKRLEATMLGAFKVTDHDEITYEGRDKAAAIRAYNEAR